MLIAARRQNQIADTLAEYERAANLAAKHEIKDHMEIHRAQLGTLRQLQADGGRTGR